MESAYGDDSPAAPMSVQLPHVVQVGSVASRRCSWCAPVRTPDSASVAAPTSKVTDVLDAVVHQVGDEVPPGPVRVAPLGGLSSRLTVIDSGVVAPELPVATMSALPGLPAEVVYE